MNIIKRRYLFFALSLLIILPGLVFLVSQIVKQELPLSIDFTGGSLLEVRFETADPPSEEIIAVYENLGVSDTQVQTTDKGSVLIRSSYIDNDQRDQILTALESEFSTGVEVLRLDSVGPSIGKQVTSRAAIAVGFAALAVVIYITVAFRGVAHASRYGVCAVIAMVHDVAVVFSITALGSAFFGWEMDALFLTALLTVIGFSVQDKIVVFDRIRENANILRRLDFETLVNHSIVQTLQRSINTQLMTVEFLLLALALMGGVTLQEFAIILLVGLLSGTYSSIFIAAPILVLWEKKEWKTWFKRPRQAAV
ncbi:MAG: protein translocase subunit SecF [Chloroflexi bacterium]|nr:protein translocase subunit SecF [Chloroflexota bacterium]